MTERQQLPRRNGAEVPRSAIPIAPADLRHQETVPTEVAGEPTILGFPADVGEEPGAVGQAAGAAAVWPVDAAGAAPVPTAPAPALAVGDPVGDLVAADAAVVDSQGRVLLLRRPDAAAGSLLLVAGAAAGMSLFLPWLQYDGELGLALFQRGLDVAGSGMPTVPTSGLVLPLTVVLGGAVLFVLGLLAFRPAPTHRATGLIALLLSLAVAAGVLVRVADVGWEAVRADPGILCAMAVAGFGLLGALKAMLTVSEFAMEPR
jgi:hypothetical protein